MSKKPNADRWNSILTELDAKTGDDSVSGSDFVEKPQDAKIDESKRECDVKVPEKSETPAKQNLSIKPETPVGKSTKFGSGILPDGSPASANPKSAISKRTSKMSFFDRLSSINLFGAGSPEKVDRSAAVPTETFVRTTTVTEQVTVESLEPPKLEKIETPPKGKRPPKTAEGHAPPPTADPWSRLATQLEVKRKDKERTETTKITDEKTEFFPTEDENAGIFDANDVRKSNESSRKDRAGTRSESSRKTSEKTVTTPLGGGAPEEDVPDIESLISFRHLPSKKQSVSTPPSQQQQRQSKDRKIPEVRSSSVSPPSRASEKKRPEIDEKKTFEGDSERARHDSFAREVTGRGKSQRKDRECSPEFATEDRSSDRKKRGRKYEDLHEQEILGVYDEPFDSVDSNDFPTGSERKGKHERPFRKKRDDFESFDDIEGIDREFDDDFAPKTERKYGPTRDVFADILPDDDDLNIAESADEDAEPRHHPRSSPGRLTRGSRNSDAAFSQRKTRDAYQEPAPQRDFDDAGEETRESFRRESLRGRDSREKNQTRGSRGEHKRRSFEEIDETTVSGAFSEEKSRRSPRQHSQSVAREPISREETGQDSGERIDLSQHYRNLPSWDDAILPIVKENIARHGNRRHDFSGRSRGRR